MLLSPSTFVAALAGASTALARSLDLASRTEIAERATSYCDVFNSVDVESGLYTVSTPHPSKTQERGAEGVVGPRSSSR